MPYKLSKKDGKWCVLKEGGESTGCSDTRAMAVKHMRALYANEKSKAWHPDAGYLNEYIRYCNMLIEQAQYSFQYDEPEHEELATFSERLIDQLSDYEEQLVGWRNQWYGSREDFKSTGVSEDSIVQRVLDGIKGLVGLQPATASSTLEVTKQADGRVRVTMCVSNVFKDRHSEIITEEAHKEYEAYVAETGQYPEFWLWHIPGSKWGQADLVKYDDGFLTVSGLADSGMEYIADSLARQQKDMGVSHGFKGWGRQGYVDWYRMKEASPLPRSEAANVWTGVLEKGMALTDKQKKFLDALGVPQVLIEDIDKRNKSFDTALKEAEEALAPQASIEVTLPDGTKVQVPQTVLDEHKQATPVSTPVGDPPKSGDPPTPVGTPDEVPAWAKELIESNKALRTELEEVKAHTTVESWEAAIKSGKGFEASKQGEPPSEEQKKDDGRWLAELIAGGSN